MRKAKLIRITTHSISLKILLKDQLSFMNSKFEVIGIASNIDGFLYQVEKEENIKVYDIPMHRTISPFKDLVSLFYLCWVLIKEKPEIVHSHTPKAGIVGMLAAKLTGVPIRLHTVAGLPLMEATGYKRKLLEFVEMVTYSLSTRVYPNSKGLYDFILSHIFSNSSKLKVIGNGSTNGIDTSFFNPVSVNSEQITLLKNELNIQDGDFVFSFVGRLVGDKGLNELIQAFKKITEEIKDKKVKLILVGAFEGNLDPLNIKTLTELKKNKNILSVGFQKDIRPYLSISNCFVFPSYREGFPNVVMQAGAMGLPCIVSDINGCNEIIVDGVNGLIVTPKSISELENAMKRIVLDDTLNRELSINSRNMITSRFEQKVVWEAILQEYNSLLTK